MDGPQISNKKIAVVGAGPAGSMAASLLAEAGHEVLLFERKGGAWEKPCGGGVTAKGIQRYPFLLDAMIEKKSIRHIELLDHQNRSVHLPLRVPLYIYSRKALNELMLQRALSSGAHLVAAHIKALEAKDTGMILGDSDCKSSPHWTLHTPHGSFEADYVIIANGAKSSLADTLGHNFTTADYSSAMGYHLPLYEDFIRIQFLKQFKGYIWTFPRCDHLSLGICSKLSEHSADELKSFLHLFARKIYGRGIPANAYFYSALIPTPELETLHRLKISGPHWALIGDAAGLVDPITGEGIYFAIRSAELLVQSLLEGQVDQYLARVREDFGLNHQRAAQLMPTFYTGRFWGGEFTTRMIQFARASRTIHSILAQLFEEQDYIQLKRRLKHQMLHAVFEAALGLRPRSKDLIREQL
jgi:geranylgeranyl diphosphate/geranylgeranyl-bacteriochlorophyllide a reductase